ARTGLHEERPRERDERERRRDEQHERRAAAQPDRVHRAAPASKAARTCSTVSHGNGARILATCGAYAGDATTISSVGPSAINSPSASNSTRCVACATNSTSCVDT